MTSDPAAAIAQSVLYEGYLLYPYRPSSLKNQQRWGFGALFPRAYSEFGGTDPWFSQTECLIEGDGDAEISLRLRFLQFVGRAVDDQLDSESRLFSTNADLTGREEAAPPSWCEAFEREITMPEARLAELAMSSTRVPIEISGGRMSETGKADPDGAETIARTSEALAGCMAASAEIVSPGIWRLTCRVENASKIPLSLGLVRDEAQRWAFASAHVIFGVRRGAFVSMTDPPDGLRAAAGACENVGVWPVLVGEPGASDMMLSSAIILPDYPRVAPESSGDLFDGCEIEEILTLRILTMTDAEKREMAAADPRARALLDRTENLSAAELERLHGALRRPSDDPFSAPPRGAKRPRIESIFVSGRRISIGDQVRLRPRGRADAMDIIFDGMTAVVETLERDFEDRVHVAVTVLDDPGRDLGADRYPGHRFFFSVDEIEPAADVDAPP